MKRERGSQLPDSLRSRYCRSNPYIRLCHQEETNPLMRPGQRKQLFLYGSALKKRSSHHSHHRISGSTYCWQKGHPKCLTNTSTLGLPSSRGYLSAVASASLVESGENDGASSPVCGTVEISVCARGNNDLMSASIQDMFDRPRIRKIS